MQTEHEIARILKGIGAVLQRQQAQFEMLFRSYSGLLTVLSGDGETPAVDRAAIEKARAEILELERLFDMGSDDPAEA